MAIDTSTLLRHMAWANQRLFAAVQTVPAEALTSYLTDPDFNVARLLQHLVEGAEWFAYCACGNPWRERQLPTNAAEIALLAEELAELDAIVLRESARDDEVLAIEMEEGLRHYRRSTVVSQAVHHATEHRAQLVDALALRGHPVINLDDLDLWSFEISQR